MKRTTGIMLLGVVIALILVVNTLEAGSVLKPTTIVPSPPSAAAMISAQHYASLTGLIRVPETARRSLAMNGGTRGLVIDADSHYRSNGSPLDDERGASKLH